MADETSLSLRSGRYSNTAGVATPWLIHRALSGGWQIHGYGSYIALILYIVESCVAGTVGTFCGSMLGIRWVKSGGLLRGAGAIAAAVGTGIAVGTLAFFAPWLLSYSR
jgi:hypothetical protein